LWERDWTSFNAPSKMTLHWEVNIVPDDCKRLGILIAGMQTTRKGNCRRYVFYGSAMKSYNIDGKL